MSLSGDEPWDKSGKCKGECWFKVDITFYDGSGSTPGWNHATTAWDWLDMQLGGGPSYRQKVVIRADHSPKQVLVFGNRETILKVAKRAMGLA